MSPAERLRAAATRLREDVATMHPPVALALADWLDDLAAGWPWDDDACVWDDGTPMRLEESLDTHALAVADALLGGEQR